MGKCLTFFSSLTGSDGEDMMFIGGDGEIEREREDQAGG